MTLSTWKYFFLHNFGRSSRIWYQIESALNIWKISKRRKFKVRTNFFVGSDPGSWAHQQEGQEDALHFERLIDVLAPKLTELWWFQTLTYFLPWWRYLWSVTSSTPKRYTDLPVRRIHICFKFGVNNSNDAACIASIPDKQTDRQTDGRTNKPTNEHTCQN